MTSDPVEPFPLRVERVFHQAWELKEPARAAFLEEACREDLPVRQAVEALLNAGARAERDPLWNEPAIQREARDLAADQGNTQLDRYRLLEQIGAGGMGMVYKAVRADDEYSKLVAVKIVQAGDRALAERLRQERQILANLEHPGIARLLDGGTTAGGLPFLVMEFVDGAPIDRYCADRSLSLDDRLELFSKITRAVAYAHRNLVVHRDLKPGNILVAADGEPKLLDFGIAKPLGIEEAGHNFAYTPEYASPEQKRGLAATTSSDIYSLGVLLGKLIPFCDLDGDLRAIVTKATEENPEERYPNVDSMAEDVLRFRRGRTVLAREQGIAYRAGKFAGRHKWAAAAAGVVAAIVATSATVAWRDRRVAEQRLQEVRQIADTGQFQPGGSLSVAAEATVVRGTLNERAVASLEHLLRESPDDRNVQRDLATAYARLALVQGTVFSANVGDRKKARATMEKALDLRERLFTADPANVNDRAALIDALGYLGRMALSNGDPVEAYNLHTRAWREAQPLLALGAAPDEPYRSASRLEYLLGIDLGGIGYSANLGDPASALAHHTHSLQIAEQWAQAHPKINPNVQFALREQILGVDLMRLGRLPEAEVHARRAVALLPPQRPALGSSGDPRTWCTARFHLALILVEEEKQTEAIAQLRQALTPASELVEGDPNNVRARLDLALIKGLLGRAQKSTSRLNAAIVEQERLLKGDPGSAEVRGALTLHYLWAAENALASRNWAEAERRFGQAESLASETSRTQPSDANARENLAAARHGSEQARAHLP